MNEATPPNEPDRWAEDYIEMLTRTHKTEAIRVVQKTRSYLTKEDAEDLFNTICFEWFRQLQRGKNSMIAWCMEKDADSSDARGILIYRMRERAPSILRKRNRVADVERQYALANRSHDVECEDGVDELLKMAIGTLASRGKINALDVRIIRALGSGCKPTDLKNEIDTHLSASRLRNRATELKKLLKAELDALRGI